MSEALALVAAASLTVAPFWILARGPQWRINATAEIENRREARKRARVRALVEHGRIRRQTARAMHNDFDDACRFWWGDRRPARDDQRNRDFGGASAPLRERRCVICRPHAEAEEAALLNPATVTPALHARCDRKELA